MGEFHNITKEDGVKLLLRFADTKAQKMLKQQSNERRAYRAGEYNYSVEVVQGSTPSPSLQRFPQNNSQITPNSQVSYTSPVGVGSNWTPATSISPTYVPNPICDVSSLALLTKATVTLSRRRQQAVRDKAPCLLAVSMLSSTLLSTVPDPSP